MVGPDRGNFEIRLLREWFKITAPTIIREIFTNQKQICITFNTAFSYNSHYSNESEKLAKIKKKLKFQLLNPRKSKVKASNKAESEQYI